MDGGSNVPLVVDLDGSLARTDLLHEGLAAHLSTAPHHLLTMLARLNAGKAPFKRWLADQTVPDLEHLPMNDAVVTAIDAARAAGRPVALVTASDQIYADAVAARMGIFDEVHGSDGERNLGGTAKAAFLVERFGRAGFDYIGDSKADLPVWAEARHALPVGPARNLPIQTTGEILPLDGGGDPKSVIRALRPHQWLKNMLIALPMLTALQVDLPTILMVLAAFICFSLTASSVYVVNDILDLASDRRHPRKSKRPFAAGEVSIATGMKVAGLCASVAFLLAVAVLPLVFLLVLAAYYVATFAYSLLLKKRAVIDICTLAGLYSIRVIAGGAATGIVLSPWLLAFSMFIFLALAAVKRQAELVDQLHTDPDRKTGRPYEVEDLPIVRTIAMSAGHAAVLVLALYINSQTAVRQYALPEAFWLACPLMLYWLIRMVMVTHRRRMTDDPIVFALRDRVSWGVMGAVFVAAAVAKVGL